MAATVHSISSISIQDPHNYFIYFLPARRLENEWVNVWVDNNFNKIADIIGPNKGIIVGPSPKHYEKYFQSIMKIFEGVPSCFRIYPSANRKQGLHHPDKNRRAAEYSKSYLEEEIVDSGKPFLIFSGRPVHDIEARSLAFMIDLNSCDDEKELARTFDILIDVIRNNDMRILEKVDELLSKPIDKDVAEFMDLVELRPSLFGVGVNLNLLLKKFAEKIIEQKNKDR